MEESANRQSSQSRRYYIKKGGLCRILEMVLLIVVEACLGAAAASESDRGLFHQIIVAIPLGSILFLLLCHLIFGPHEAWPVRRGCSWPKIETAHDVLVFALLLISSLVLLVRPFTTLEASAAVLTLVAVLLVAIQGVDNLQKTKYRSSQPLVAAETSCNIPYTRRPRRGSVSNISSPAFSPKVIPCSTPDCISSKSPSSPQFYVHEADTATLLNKRLDSEKSCSCRESPIRMSPLGAPGTPKSESFTCGTLSALSSRTYAVNNSIEYTTCTVSKSPGHNAVQNMSVAPIFKTLSPDSEFLRNQSLGAHGLIPSKSSVAKGSLTNSKKNQNHSFSKVPTITLIGPTPELKFPFKNRINESEMGSSPLLRESDVVSVDMENHGDSVSPLFRPAVFMDAESPKSVSANTPVAAKLRVEPVTPDPSDALTEELGDKISAQHPKRTVKNITSLKSLDEFSLPKTFFNDESKQLLSGTPQPVTGPVVNSSFEGTPTVSSQPRPSLHTSRGLPYLPPLSMDYVRVYPTPQPYMRSLGTSLHLSHNLPGTEEFTEEKLASLSKSQSICGDAHHYENEAVVCPTQQHEKSSRSQTPYQLLKRKTETEGTEEVITSFGFQCTDLTTEL